MKKKHIMIIVMVLLVVLLLCIAVYEISTYVQSSKLCDLIQRGDTEKALSTISHMQNVNQYSSPLFIRKLLNIVSCDIELPLVEACRAGNYDIVIALLEKGADPNRYLDGGWSPIEATFIQPNAYRFDIAQALLKYGADVDLCGSGDTALFNELQHLIYSDSIADAELQVIQQSIELLLNHGAFPFDDKGNSIIHYLSYAQAKDLLSNIVNKYGYEIDVKNNIGETPLMWAIEGESLENVRFLLNSGANSKSVDNSGKTIMDYAFEKNNQNIIDALKGKTGDGFA